MDKVLEIFTDQIDDPSNPMRSELDRSALFELADNIKQNGLINPITVRPKGDRYEVVAGHRRISACKIAGVIKIPCVVRVLNDQETFAVKAAENLEREDVNPVDEATFISEYMRETGAEPKEVAKALRRSISFVESRMVVGQMPDYMKEYLGRGELKLGAALALFKIDNDHTRRLWVDMAVRDGVSVAQAEYWLHGYEVGKLPGGANSDTPPSDFQYSPPSKIMFECAVDKKEYDPKLCRNIVVYEGNLPILEALLSEWRKVPADPVPEPGA